MRFERRQLAVRQSGYTLIEVLVAFMILALALTVLMRIFSGGLRNVSVSSDYAVATLIAESRLAATAVELDETKARLAELVELRAKPVPASPSRSSSSSGRAAESVRDIIVAAAEAAASRKRGLLNGAPKGEGDPSSEDAFASIEESEELERRVHARVEEALAQAQREWRSEMDAMDAERCAEVASLRDALARLRAESDEERLENQFNGESHEKERADAAEARAVLAEERVASAERAAATTAAELATERDRSASLVAELETVRRERVDGPESLLPARALGAAGHLPAPFPERVVLRVQAEGP